MIPLGNDVFYVLRAPLVADARTGSLSRDWSQAARLPVIWALITPFELAQKLSVEDNREREFSQTHFKVFAPPGTDIVYTDRIEYWSEVYIVSGSVRRWRDFDGCEDHVEFVVQLQGG